MLRNKLIMNFSCIFYEVKSFCDISLFEEFVSFIKYFQKFRAPVLIRARVSLTERLQCRF